MTKTGTAAAPLVLRKHEKRSEAVPGELKRGTGMDRKRSRAQAGVAELTRSVKPRSCIHMQLVPMHISGGNDVN